MLEIFVVNDRSADDTHEIITEFIKDNSQFNYLINKSKNPNLSGKANAISQAIKKSNGEIILITDADCEAPSRWIQNMTSFFNKDVGMVAGFTQLKDSGIFTKMQLMDWSYMLSIAAGAIGLGIPLTCIGNNFAIRRKAYQQVGGYEGVGFSVAEDFALLQAVKRKTNWQVVATMDLQSFVQSKAVTNLKDFFKQRKRWAIGGISVPWFGKLLIFTSVFVQVAILSLLMMGNVLLAGELFLVTLICDIFLLFNTFKKTKKLKLLFLLPLYKIFSFIYMLILFAILVFNPTVEWKGDFFGE